MGIVDDILREAQRLAARRGNSGRTEAELNRVQSVNENKAAAAKKKKKKKTSTTSKKKEEEKETSAESRRIDKVSKYRGGDKATSVTLPDARFDSLHLRSLRGENNTQRTKEEMDRRQSVIENRMARDAEKVSNDVRYNPLVRRPVEMHEDTSPEINNFAEAVTRKYFQGFEGALVGHSDQRNAKIAEDYLTGEYKNRYNPLTKAPVNMQVEDPEKVKEAEAKAKAQGYESLEEWEISQANERMSRNDDFYERKATLDADVAKQNYGTLGNTLTEVAEVIGSMTPTIAAGYLGGAMVGALGLTGKAAWLMRNIVSGAEIGNRVSGQETKYLYDRLVEESRTINGGQKLSIEEYESAINKASDAAELVGLAEVGTEMLFGGLDFLGKGLLDDVVSKLGWNMLSPETKKVIEAWRGTTPGRIVSEVVRRSNGAIGEGMEEGIMSIVQPVIETNVADVESKVTLENIVKDFGLGAAVSLVLGIPVSVASSTGVVMDAISEKKSNKEFINAIKDRADELVKAGVLTKEDYSSTMAEVNDILAGKGSLNVSESQEEVKVAGEALDTVYDSYEEASKAMRAEAKTKANGERISANYIENGEVKTFTTAVQNGGLALGTSKTAAPEYQKIATAKNVTERSGYQLNVKEEIIKEVASLSKAIGREIEFYRNDDASDHGRMDKKTGKIYINAGSSQSAARSVIAHELTHQMENTAGWKGIVELMKKHYGSSYESRRQERIDAYEAFGKPLEVDETRKTYDEADQELVAMFVEEKLLTDADTIREVVNTDKTLAQKIIAWINKVIQKLAGNKEQKMLVEARDLWNQALQEEQSGKVKPRTIEEEVTDDAGVEVRSSIGKDNQLMNRAETRNKTTKAVSKEDLDIAREARETIKEEFQHLFIADAMSQKGKSPLVGNDSYAGSLDNTTICSRSLTLESIVELVAEKFGRPLTNSEAIVVAQELMEYTGDRAECLYCYQANAKRGYEDALYNFVEQRRAVIDRHRNGMDEDTNYKLMMEYDFEKDKWTKKDTPSARERFETFIKIADNKIPMAPALKMANTRTLYAEIENTKNSKNIVDQLKQARTYAQGAVKAHGRVYYAVYNGQILRVKQGKIDDWNRTYGLRMYSFSDFSPAFILENMQMVTDAAVRGLRMLSYTKEPEFVSIFGDTGMAINISVAGVPDGKGGYHSDGMQGMDWEQAKTLRILYPTAGTVYVAKNDAEVEWAMEQDWIDTVIPFHISYGSGMMQRTMGWTNYSGQQSEKKKAGWTKDDKVTIYPSEHQNDRETYLKLCEENHLTPKFPKWQEHPNYMKLVNETRLAPNEMNPVQPKFNAEAARATLRQFAKSGGYNPILGGTEENRAYIAEDIAQKVKNRAPEVEARDRRFSLGSQKIPQTWHELVDGRNVEVVQIGNTPRFLGNTANEKRTNIVSDLDRRGVLSKPHLNKDTNTLIFVMKQGLHHSLKNLSADTIAVVNHIPEIIANAAFIGKGRKDDSKKVYNTYALIAGVQNKKDPFPVKLIVKEYRIGNSVLPPNVKKYLETDPEMREYARFYDATVLVAEIEEADDHDRVYPKMDDAPTTPASKISLAELLEPVKVELAEYLPKDSLNKDYYKAIRSGDMILAQRYVDAMAKAAGYTRKAFHETKQDNTIHIFNMDLATNASGDYKTPYGIFTKSHSRSVGLGGKQMALYVKADKTFEAKDRDDFETKMPEQYWNLIDELKAINKRYDQKQSELEDRYFDLIDDFFDNEPNGDQLRMQSDVSRPMREQFAVPEELESVEIDMESIMSEWESAEQEAIANVKKWLTNWLKSNGYDSMSLEYDNGAGNRVTDAFIVLKENQVKSADPVTYDDEGNIIPLSERFNPKNNDIRWSVGKTDADTMKQARNYLVGDTVSYLNERATVVERSNPKGGTLSYTIELDNGDRIEVTPDQLQVGVTPKMHFDELDKDVQKQWKDTPDDWDGLYDDAYDDLDDIEPPKKRGKENPLELDDVRYMLSDYADMLGDPTAEELEMEWAWTKKLTGQGVSFLKDYVRNIEAASNGNKQLEYRLRELFVKPFQKGKSKYVSGVHTMLDELYDKMQELGIQKESPEAAAVIKYGEKKEVTWERWYDPEAKRKVWRSEVKPYTLEDLKKDCPNTWENVVEADRWFRDKYDSYIVRINEVRREIYGHHFQHREMEIKTARERANQHKESRNSLEAQLYDIEQCLRAKRTQLAVKRNAKDAKVNELEKEIDYNNQYRNTIVDLIEEHKEKEAHYTSLANELEQDLLHGQSWNQKRLKRREDYYHHMREESGFLEDLFLNGRNSEIDPALEGKSVGTKPKAKWSGIFERQGIDPFRYDAVASFIDYIQAAEYAIHMDPVISQFRADIYNMATATQESRNANKLILWLTNWTNDLSGKTTDHIDRFVQERIGRDNMRKIRKIVSRSKFNAVGVNLNSAVAQFGNLPNALAYVQNPQSWGKGLQMYTKWLTRDDAVRRIVKESTFLDERYLDTVMSKFDQRLKDKPEKFAAWLLRFGDQHSTFMIWCVAYEDAVRQNKKNPIRIADEITMEAVAGRGVGEVPLQMKSTWTNIVAPFQIEVNNAYQIYKKKVKTMTSTKSTKQERINAGTSFLLLLLGNFVANTVSDLLTHRRILFDPIYVLLETIGEWVEGDDDDKNWWDKTRELIGKEIGNIFSNMPYGDLIAYYAFNNEWAREKLFGDYDPTRFGVGNIVLDWGTEFATDLVTGEDIADDLLGFVTTFVTPFGGKQLERLVDGFVQAGVLPDIDISTSELPSIRRQKAPGVYNSKDELLFPIPTFADDPWNALIAIIFGAYTTEYGEKYLGKDRENSKWWENILGWNKIKEQTALNERATAVYNALVADGADQFGVYDTLRNIQNADKTTDKRNALLDAISEGNITEEDAINILLGYMTQKNNVESVNKKLTAFTDAGLTVTDYLEVSNLYSMISENEAYEGAQDRANAFVSELAAAGYSADQINSINDVMKYFSHIPANIDKFTDMTAAGLSTETSVKVQNAIAALEPLEGKTTVSELQKAEAIAGLKLSADEELAAMSLALTEATYTKYKVVSGYGVNAQVWVDFKNALSAADAENNSNGSYDKEEKMAALDSLNVSNETRAALWQTMDNMMYNTEKDTSWKAARNPYSSSVGAAVVDGCIEARATLQAEKEASGESAYGNPVGFELTEDKISSGYGYRVHPISGKWKMHDGIDIRANQGEPILAAGDGTVVKVVSSNTGYGNHVIIEHEDGTQTLYAHMYSYGVKEGQTVSKGEQIGEVGNTGSSTGNHLHFEVRVDGKAVNPQSVFDLTGEGIMTSTEYAPLVSGGGSSNGGGGSSKSSGSTKTSSSSGYSGSRTAAVSSSRTSTSGSGIVLPGGSNRSSAPVVGRSTSAPTYGSMGITLPKASDYTSGSSSIRSSVATTQRTGRTGGSFWDDNILS